MNQIYLYGLSGPDKKYKCLRYSYIESEFMSIKELRMQAGVLLYENGSIEHVYAIDNRRGLYSDYRESIKKNTIESCIIFRDILTREGIQII